MCVCAHVHVCKQIPPQEATAAIKTPRNLSLSSAHIFPLPFHQSLQKQQKRKSSVLTAICNNIMHQQHCILRNFFSPLKLDKN